MRVTVCFHPLILFITTKKEEEKGWSYGYQPYKKKEKTFLKKTVVVIYR